MQRYRLQCWFFCFWGVLGCLFFFISSISLGLGLLLTEESEQGENGTSQEGCPFSNISLLGFPLPKLQRLPFSQASSRGTLF